jgi:UDP-N-acetylglucosamine 2-epimerase
MRILTVFGTRPEAIKMAPVIRRLARTPRVECRVCVTAQHRQMLDQVLHLFAIRPDYDLDVMREAQDLTYVTSAVLEGLQQVYRDLRPDWVVVQGDTTTTLGAALAAFYAKIPIAHVEAGLRTWNPLSPWPEEMNRCLTTKLATLHFAPTEESSRNLVREGIDPSRITVTGNTVIDALFDTVSILDSESLRLTPLLRGLPSIRPQSKLVLATVHRRENFDGGLKRVALGLLRLAERTDVEVVLPLHPNPHVQQEVRPILGSHPRIHLIPPVDYLPFVHLMRRATIIVTDSGGIQEEAPSLGKPVLVTRDTTERPEAVEAGTVELVGTDTDRLVTRATRLLDDPSAYEAMSGAHNPYGDGHAANRILEALING